MFPFERGLLGLSAVAILTCLFVASARVRADGNNVTARHDFGQFRRGDYWRHRNDLRIPKQGSSGPWSPKTPEHTSFLG